MIINKTSVPLSFKIKTNLTTCIVIQLIDPTLSGFDNQLKSKISSAPNFFIGSPVIIDLELIPSCQVDFHLLKNFVLENNMVPVGVRGGDIEQITAAVSVGLPLVSISKELTPLHQPTIESIRPTELPEPIELLPSPPISLYANPKIVTTPVRSGMQIYAKNCDLIIIAAVSVGAEILADGNIHVYGTLRGRALAGVTGNVEAQIFAKAAHAELIAIAGYYLTKDELLKLNLADDTYQMRLISEKICAHKL
jgi:septum site-determining protein MinC